MDIMLIVKGSEDQARSAAAAHGFTIAGVRSASGQETLLDAYGSEHEAARWLCEPPLVAPFPVGTLLYYR